MTTAWSLPQSDHCVGESVFDASNRVVGDAGGGGGGGSEK